MPQFRPRISLLSMLLLMTIVGMGIVLWQLWHEVEPLRGEVHRLRQELGYLTVHDKDQIYAIQVPSPEPGVHRYRIYLPENRRFKLHTRLHTIPGRASDDRDEWLVNLLKSRSGSSSEIQTGEHTIDVQVRRVAEKDDEWRLEYRIAGKGAGSVSTNMPWLEDRRTWAISSEASVGRQLERPAAEGLVLFALRKSTIKEFEGGYSTYSPDETKDCEGLMLWIAPAERGD